MPTNTSAWYMNSLPLKFLFLPFKAAYTLFLIVLLIFGSSMLTQTILVPVISWKMKSNGPSLLAMMRFQEMRLAIL